MKNTNSPFFKIETTNVVEKSKFNYGKVESWLQMQQEKKQLYFKAIANKSKIFGLISKYKELDRTILTAFSGLALSIMAFFFCDELLIDFKTLLIVMTMGLLISPISRVLLGNGAKYISASEVSLLMIIETVMAPIWVWIFLNEVPSSYTFIGGSIIIATLLINSLYTLKKS